MDPFQPLQLKGEVMDLEFTIDTDHRKRRRNRTTQSCLNCHTSKRKCDRKRPCQRCIQLGLTGLCVYEIDDPALRDDPSVDETTRLRNRIAELESLVRELRGKPHPRWADSSFRDGDPNEKWHSRATKCAPLSAAKRTRAPSPSVKAEAPPDSAPGAGGTLYRFSPSPPAPPPSSMRYHQSEYAGGSYHSSPGSGSYAGNGNSNGNGYEGGEYARGGGGYAGEEAEHPYCSCRAHPGASHAYMSLSHQLQSTLSALRQYSVHPGNTPCLLYRRITELHNLMQFRPSEAEPGTYDSNTPTDSEILTPLSASSSTHGGGGGAPFHNSSPPGGVSPHEWNTMSTPNYNPYFPMQGSEHGGMYNHIIT
ncbi:hypothetical protein EDD18DRAFT_1133272 [Armillaria luteobubalina]|uniref:Zn(2)-C6 fungal-type domain-containing protein n=1 Tax=Armillaria luteobubalina TaxID=153913 RepID=A0AA39QM48_9AGAR|nr:hypothetical protein EDD18DRAFT_1133272 [Armillaria luteobubalina]